VRFGVPVGGKHAAERIAIVSRQTQGLWNALLQIRAVKAGSFWVGSRGQSQAVANGGGAALAVPLSENIIRAGINHTFKFRRSMTPSKRVSITCGRSKSTR
jgi:hypothetical protein